MMTAWLAAQSSHSVPSVDCRSKRLFLNAVGGLGGLVADSVLGRLSTGAGGCVGVLGDLLVSLLGDAGDALLDGLRGGVDCVLDCVGHDD